MLMNKYKLINSTYKEKLTYELWLEEYKNKHCERCLMSVPAPANCYICYQQSRTGFHCSHCSNFVYYVEGKVCGGSYDTGTCFCKKCQEAITKWLANKSCACEYSLAGYSAGHPIRDYHLTINGLAKPFFKGSKLWIKLVCRSCGKTIQTFKLNCSCYLEQKKHSHLYSKKRCLNCVAGTYIQPLSEWDLQDKYKEYCQIWQEREEIQAEISIKRQYRYDGVSYWAECSFCAGEIQGQRTHQEPLSRNKVSFWTENEADGRVICNGCLRKKEIAKELDIKGMKRQMLYNYRGRGIV